MAYARISLLMQGETPVGVWITDGKEFDNWYLDNEDGNQWAEFFSYVLRKVDWKTIDEKGFWEYWTSQGMYNLFWSGPFQISIKGEVSMEGETLMKDLSALHEKLKQYPVYDGKES